MYAHVVCTSAPTCIVRLVFAARRRTAGRVHRLGQTKDVTVHRIVVEHTVEMAIREIARRRQAMCVGRLIMFL